MKKRPDLRDCSGECDAYSDFVDAYGKHHFYCAKSDREIKVFGRTTFNKEQADIIICGNWHPEGMYAVSDDKVFPDWCLLEDAATN